MKRLDDIEVKRRLEKISFRGISMLDPFIGVTSRNTFKCAKCLYVWSATFHDIDTGRGCSQCSGLYKSASKIAENIALVKARGINLLDDYKKASDTYKFQCLKCSHIWESQFTQVFNNRGCNNCAINERAKKRSLSSEEINIRVQKLSSRNIELIDEYKSTLSKHKFRCMKCSYVWSTTFDAVHRGTGCSKCKYKNKGQILTEDEKYNANANKLLRTRLAGMFSKGQTATKVYKNADGSLNDLWNVISDHWCKEYRLITKKPDNGNWDLDHIIPISWFNAYDIEQLKLCWHHKNLRWLNRTENRSKGSRLRPQDLEILTDWHYSAIDKASYVKPFSNS